MKRFDVIKLGRVRFKVKDYCLGGEDPHKEQDMIQDELKEA